MNRTNTWTEHKMGLNVEEFSDVYQTLPKGDQDTNCQYDLESGLDHQRM